MTAIEITRELAVAAATDAGNRSMRNGGRTAWNWDDYCAACACFETLELCGNQNIED